MWRGTTPDYILTLSGYDLTNKRVYVTLSQKWPEGNSITLTNDSVEITVDDTQDPVVSTISLSLTQEQTLSFTPGAASIQVKIIDSDSHVDCTNIATIQIDKALLERVITYDGE